MRAVAYVTLICVLAVTVTANLYPWTVRWTSRGPVSFEIPQGASVAEVARLLADNGLIANEDVFKAGAVFLRMDRKISAGRYVMPPRTSLVSLYRELLRGQRHLNLVTVPEGLTLPETAGILVERLGIDAGELGRWACDRGFMSELGISGESAEGYLFPDTYDMPPGSHPRDIISTMAKRALEVFSRAYRESDSPLGLDVNEVFTLASIVQAEVTYGDEAPRVAAVFLNRLRTGMPLQADPTVAYALGERKAQITYRDLEVDSPYNTYVHAGLPPGPICSPGESSIRAVLNPAFPSSEMYFVARGDGRHVFSETIDEHVKAKEEFRARRDAQ